MKIFEFEQNLKNEFGDINVIYNSNSEFRITTMIGRNQTNELFKQKRVTYTTLEALILKSSQFDKFKSLKTLLVEMKCTDASKWMVSEIEKEFTQIKLAHSKIITIFECSFIICFLGLEPWLRLRLFL